ncbi:MAG: nucleotidyltransferase substrate binding protein [Mariprofundales bacterium]
MSSGVALLARSNQQKCLAAIALVQASVDKLAPYDAVASHTPDTLEPYDALADRFIRAVEVSIKFFRSYERYQEGAVAETFRDLMHRMEKYGLISAVVLWVEMRDVRNRIVHDYLPQRMQELFDLLQGDYAAELMQLRDKVAGIQL